MLFHLERDNRHLDVQMLADHAASEHNPALH